LHIGPLIENKKSIKSLNRKEKAIRSLNKKIKAIRSLASRSSSKIAGDRRPCRSLQGRADAGAYRAGQTPEVVHAGGTATGGQGCLSPDLAHPRQPARPDFARRRRKISPDLSRRRRQISPDSPAAARQTSPPQRGARTPAREGEGEVLRAGGLRAARSSLQGLRAARCCGLREGEGEGAWGGGAMTAGWGSGGARAVVGWGYSALRD
jgi:hypothetical protein